MSTNKKLTFEKYSTIIKQLAVSNIGIPCNAEHNYKNDTYTTFVVSLRHNNHNMFVTISDSTLKRWIKLAEDECLGLKSGEIMMSVVLSKFKGSIPTNDEIVEISKLMNTIGEEIYNHKVFHEDQAKIEQEKAAEKLARKKAIVEAAKRSGKKSNSSQFKESETMDSCSSSESEEEEYFEDAPKKKRKKIQMKASEIADDNPISLLREFLPTIKSSNTSQDVEKLALENENLKLKIKLAELQNSI